MVSTDSSKPEIPAVSQADPDADHLAAMLARLERESTPEKAKLMRHWLSLRDGGMPDYRRFDPLDIPNLLGNLAVIDVERPGPRFRFRLYGTRIVDIRGRDLTGLYLDDADVLPDHQRDAYLQGYRAVLATGLPVFGTIPYDPKHRVVGNYHRLLLPFTDGRRGDGTCNVLLGSFQSVPLGLS